MACIYLHNFLRENKSNIQPTSVQHSIKKLTGNGRNMETTAS